MDISLRPRSFIGVDNQAVVYKFYFGSVAPKPHGSF